MIKKITIKEATAKEISTGNTVIEILAKPEEGKEYGDKFQFWKLHKGQWSKAYTQYKKGVEAGLTFEIDYSEEEQDYTQKDGKPGKSTKRTIWEFHCDGEGVPIVYENATQEQLEAKDEIPVVDLSEEIKPEDLPFS